MAVSANFGSMFHLAEIVHQSRRTWVLYASIIRQMWPAILGRKWFPSCAKFGTWMYLESNNQVGLVATPGQVTARCFGF